MVESEEVAQTAEEARHGLALNEGMGEVKKIESPGKVKVDEIVLKYF